MIVFWALCLAMGLAVAGIVCLPLLRGRGPAASRAEHDAQVYRDQLAEVERDLARGVLDRAAYEATKVEVSRRLLAAADEAGREADGDEGGSRGLAVALGAVLLVASGGLYFVIGAPGQPDRPLAVRLAEAEAARADRPSQAEAEAAAAASGIGMERPEVAEEYLTLVDQLRQAMVERPDDVQGLRLMALHLPRIGEWTEAARVQERLVAVLGEAARGEDYADLAENLIIAAGGYVSPEAEDALEEGMRLDPVNPRIRFYAGHALLQSGRPDLTYNLWARLLQEGPADAPWVAAIEAQIGEVAAAIGAPLPGGRGPSAADVDAAGQMSEEDRAAMIEGMVSGLSDRLATEGGPVEDWAKLIRAYGVLGETGQASAIWNEAREVFGSDERALALLREAAREAEVAN